VLGGRYADKGFRFLREISATRILLPLLLIILGILATSFYYGRWEFIARTEQLAPTPPTEKPAPAEPKTGINVLELQEISDENRSAAMAEPPVPGPAPLPENSSE